MDKYDRLEKEYRDTIFKNREDYPNLYQLEIRKNRWKFKQQNWNKNKPKI